MLEPRWEAPPDRASPLVFQELADLPKLLVHLATLRVGSPASADAIRGFLFGAASDECAVGRIPRLGQLAERLVGAVRQHEPIGIHGDYDVDGVTSTALLTLWLRSLGATVVPFLPHRERNGYGLTADALRWLRDQDCRLVLAVDCGITAMAEAPLAAELGIELLVLDHHTPPDQLPAPALLVDPKLPDGDPADHGLCAAGLAYRLAQAMATMGPMGGTLSPDDLLDLVALGTIADVAPLTGQNRLLVQRGLARMRARPRLGVAALIEKAGVKRERLMAEDVAFRLAPRLNAAGRLDDPRVAFELLLARDAIEAGALAEKLNDLNRQRQAATERARQEAIAQLGPIENGEPRLLIVHGEDWHPGVVGLVAGKLTEQFCRPAIALTHAGGRLRGSARSIDGFNVTLALRECTELLLRFGGHSHAAGLSLEPHNLGALRDRLQALALQQITAEQMTPRYWPEAVVRLSTLTPSLVRQIELLGPFGAGNPAPLLQTNGLRVLSAGQLGAVGNHAQLRLSGNGVALRAVRFGLGCSDLPPAGSVVDALFTVQLDEYNGHGRVELRFEACRPATQPV